MPVQTRTLTIDLANGSLGAVAGAICRAKPVLSAGAPELPFLDEARRGFWPEPIEGMTDANGVCRLALVPTSYMPAGWLYRLQVAKGEILLERMVYMPDVDSSLFDITHLATTARSLFAGTSADAIPTGIELNLVATDGIVTFDAYAGERHQLFARLADREDIRSAIRSDDPTQENLIQGFTKYPVPIDRNGADVNVWVSNQALVNPAEVTWTVV